MALLRKYKILGNSMIPTYSSGDIVLVSKIPYYFSRPQNGDIVVFKKKNKEYIKRIVDCKKNRYFVEGDNKKESITSNELGPVLYSEIIGKLIYTVSRK